MNPGLFDQIIRKIKPHVIGWIEERLAVSEAAGREKFVPLSSPLTSTSWDGDSFSTTAKTLLDLAGNFGTPRGIKAALIRVTLRDSGSAGNDCYLILSPNGTAGQGIAVRCSGIANDFYHNQTVVVPCTADGDVYYQIAASGSGTLDVTLQVWGWWK